MSYLQDLYEGDRMFTPRPDDRDLIESLRVRGYWVQMCRANVYGRQTDAYLGESWTIQAVTKCPGEAAKWGDDYCCEDFEVTRLNPRDLEEEARLEHEAEMAAEAARADDEAYLGYLASQSYGDEDLPF